MGWKQSMWRGARPALAGALAAALAVGVPGAVAGGNDDPADGPSAETQRAVVPAEGPGDSDGVKRAKFVCGPGGNPSGEPVAMAGTTTRRVPPGLEAEMKKVERGTLAPIGAELPAPPPHARVEVAAPPPAHGDAKDTLRVVFERAGPCEEPVAKDGTTVRPVEP